MQSSTSKVERLNPDCVQVMEAFARPVQKHKNGINIKIVVGSIYENIKKVLLPET